METSYVGKAEYCYANSVSMFLATVGETVPPGTVEVLTGVGLGAFLVDPPGLLFFSGLAMPPNIGVSQSLRLLGFDFTESASTDPASCPFDDLRRMLRTAPVLIGPLDIGLLTYNGSSGATGSDHYVVLLDMNGDQVTLHDPWGFPYVFLSLAELEAAWRAD